MNDDCAIAFACDDNYLPHVATPIAAIREHHPAIRIVVITDSTGPLPEGVERIKPAPVDDFTTWTTNNPRVAHISPMSVQKLYAPMLINTKRLIIFEVDVLVRKPIDELLLLPLGSGAVGGVADRFMPTVEAARQRLGELAPPGYARVHPGAIYMQTGMVAVDVDRWRCLNLTDACMAAVRSGPLPELEQDAINLTCRPIRAFDPMLNYLIDYDTRDVPPDCRVLHYVGPLKPWHDNYPASASLDLWNHYRDKTTETG